jgi:hypothetical protein
MGAAYGCGRLLATPCFGVMRIVREASQAEVIASFLGGELGSSRFGEQLLGLLREDGMDVSVLTQPNRDDPAENDYREALLDRYRGWLRREGLFADFPQQVDWSLAALTPDEVLAIRYINWDGWLEVSGGSRRPVDAAARIRRGAVPGGNAEWHEPIAARLRSPEPPPKLIAVAQPEHARLVVLEGHVRLTAYALYPKYLPDELELFLGTAADMDRWTEF